MKLVSIPIFGANKVMTDVTLSKHAYMWDSDGGRREHANGYRVGGLPDGYEAFIINAGAPRRDDWYVLPAVNGVSGERLGHFASADEALRAVDPHVRGLAHLPARLSSF